MRACLLGYYGWSPPPHSPLPAIWPSAPPHCSNNMSTDQRGRDRLAVPWIGYQKMTFTRLEPWVTQPCLVCLILILILKVKTTRVSCHKCRCFGRGLALAYGDLRDIIGVCSFLSFRLLECENHPPGL